MGSSGNTTLPSKCYNLPCDILLLISGKLDGMYDRQLAAVCTSWNSSLPKCPSKTDASFPLEIPCPICPALQSKYTSFPFEPRCPIFPTLEIKEGFRFWVVQRSVVLLSPLKKEAKTPTAWIAEVEESGLKKHSLFNPLTGDRILPYCCKRDRNDNVGTLLPKYINLLDFGVTHITKAYSILWVDKKGCYHTHSCSPAELDGYLRIKKIITFHDNEEGIIVLLALRVDGELAFWKSGCEEWKLVDSLPVPYDCKFVDIICFDGKFCVLDKESNLLMIDPLTFKPIKSVAKPDPGQYHDMDDPSLVQCEKYLYLVRSVHFFDDWFGDPWEEDLPVDIVCFALVEEGWVANGGVGTKNHVFFMGNEITYSVSSKLLGFPRGDFSYHGGRLPNSYRCMVTEFWNNMASKKSSGFNIFSENHGSLDLIAGIYDFQDRSFTGFVLNRHSYLDVTKIFCPPLKLWCQS